MCVYDGCDAHCLCRWKKVGWGTFGKFWSSPTFTFAHFWALVRCQLHSYFFCWLYKNTHTHALLLFLFLVAWKEGGIRVTHLDLFLCMCMSLSVANCTSVSFCILLSSSSFLKEVLVLALFQNMRIHTHTHAEAHRIRPQPSPLPCPCYIYARREGGGWVVLDQPLALCVCVFHVVEEATKKMRKWALLLESQKVVDTHTHAEAQWQRRPSPLPCPCCIYMQGGRE